MAMHAKYQKIIGQRFKKFRELVRHSHDGLASILSIDVSVLEKVELGDGAGYAEVCKSLYEKFGVSSNWLLTGKGNMFIETRAYTPIYAYITANFADVEDPYFKSIADMVHLMYADLKFREHILARFHEFISCKPVQEDNSPGIERSENQKKCRG